MVEVGFKIAIALISLNIVIQAINNLLCLGLALPISLMIVLFYLINTENILVTITAYTALCISISITYRPTSYHSLHKPLYYIEKTALYLIPTLFLLSTTQKYPMLLVVVVVTSILIVAMELRMAALFNVDTSNIYLLRKLKNIDIKIRLAIKFINTLNSYTSSKTKSIAIGFANGYLKLMNILTKIENSISGSIRKALEIVISMAQNIVKIERHFENVFHRIAEAVEALQHKMEHSFILLLFLMGLLLLIAIIFYIILITV